ncbi:MAG: lipoyl(octanoyl) transferase LipB [Candidatus Omnitrophica bacterium]|nr:lipoyl(octanoyl) transferase LipB [Candidatus Omnitrophota bacterium]
MSLTVIDLGLIDYRDALKKQKNLVGEVASGAADVLILCEHPKTITLGRKFKEGNLFLPREEFIRQGFALVEADRGGDVTLHSPGQLVIYPVVDLKRAALGLKEYLQYLEQVAVDLLGNFDIVAKGDDGNRGVWINGRKIASIGIGVSRWVTYHGMGLNISTDLKLFNVIRPCGLDIRMTSLTAECNCPVVMSDVKCYVVEHFRKIFGY